MSQILNKIRDVDPNDSEAVKEALTTFFQNLPKNTECSRWLRALENIISRFPKYCTSHRGTIEIYLTHFLDSNNYYSAIEAAKCTHVLQQVKVSQDKGVSAKVSWREQMDLLCQAAHELIIVIFINNVKIYKNNIKGQKVQSSNNTPLSVALSNITNVGKFQNKQAQLCTRLKNIFVFIQAMLVEIYPVAKPVRPQIILEVILQSLTVSSGKNVSVDVAEVKTQALKTLDALIACLGSNLIPFSALVFRFVMQTLRWSTDNVSEESSKVRRAAYNSLNQWLETLRVHRAPSGGNDHSWQDELTTHLVEDITPVRKLVQLTMNSQPNKHLSKKAKKKLANTMLQESTIASHMPGEKNKIIIPEDVNEAVVLSALECTETFLTVCGIFLKPSTYKVFQELLVRECFQLSACSAARAGALLGALEAARKAGPRAAPHTHYCLHLYSTLLHSPHRQISKFCAQALLDIRLHLHCSPPSLNFALEEHPDQQKQADSKRKKVSDRNRAILEKLLGSERMPSEDLAEQVTITIQDEPSNKKPRLDEDIADKISISSESPSIVVSCDNSDAETCEQDVEIIEHVNTPVNENKTKTNVEVNDKDVVNSENETETDTTHENEGNNKTLDELVIQENQENENTNESLLVDHTIESNNTKAASIFEAKTQLPTNESNEAQDREQSPLSMEIAYDYPNTGNDTVKVLEKLDDENLPSTNDTDDIQITCGQVVKNSQDVDHDKNKDIEVSENIPKVNGIEKSTQEKANIEEEETNVTAKIAVSNDAVTVEDMLADFVDEVKDDTIKA